MIDFIKDSSGKPSASHKAFHFTMMYILPLVIGVLVFSILICAFAIKDNDMVGKFLNTLVDICGIHVSGGTGAIISSHVSQAISPSQLWNSEGK